MKLVLVLVCIATPAAADELMTLRSQVGLGASIAPDRANLASEAGYDGAAGKATAKATVEATLVGHFSVLAAASYEDRARPTLAGAYQFTDPRTSPIGTRLLVAYKPEGFTESEGEIESTLVLSRLIGANTARALFAYGQDPDGHESDWELGGSYMHRATDMLSFGGSARYRRAIKLKTGANEPAWDCLGGAVAGLSFGHSRVEVLLGADSIKLTQVQTGFVGLVGVGAEL